MVRANEGAMFEFVDNAGTYIGTSPALAVVAVFVGGLLTASNPCCLAIIAVGIYFAYEGITR